MIRKVKLTDYYKVYKNIVLQPKVLELNQKSEEYLDFFNGVAQFFFQ